MSLLGAAPAQSSPRPAAQDTPAAAAEATDAPATEGAPADIPAAEALPVAPALPTDTTPPAFDTVVVAASAAAARPVVTAVLTDDASGVERAVVYVQAPGETTWTAVPLVPSNGGLFIAQLPDGLQRTGFVYYVQAFDAAGNGPAMYHSKDAPKEVVAAAEDTLTKIAREKAANTPDEIHPIWPLLSLGTGILGLAGMTAFLLDYNTTQNRLAAGDGDKALLEATLSNDLVGAALTGGVALVGLGVGIGIAAASANAE